MKNKLFTLGFTVALILDIVAIGLIGFLAYDSFFHDLGEYQTTAQSVMVFYVLMVIYYTKLVYSDCKKNGKDSALTKGIVYGLTGGLGWQIYYSEYYQKAEDGYIEYKNVEQKNMLPTVFSPVISPVDKIISIARILFVLAIVFFAVSNGIKGGDYVGTFFFGLIIISVAVYIYFHNSSAKLKKKNPLDRDAGGLASYLVLLFFVAAMALIFYYNEYLLK